MAKKKAQYYHCEFCKEFNAKSKWKISNYLIGTIAYCPKCGKDFYKWQLTPFMKVQK